MMRHLTFRIVTGPYSRHYHLQRRHGLFWRFVARAEQLPFLLVAMQTEVLREYHAHRLIGVLMAEGGRPHLPELRIWTEYRLVAEVTDGKVTPVIFRKVAQHWERLA